MPKKHVIKRKMMEKCNKQYVELFIKKVQDQSRVIDKEIYAQIYSQSVNETSDSEAMGKNLNHLVICNKQ